MLFSIDKVDEAGDILVSGYHNRGASLSLYSYNLESWIITPVDVTAFDVRYPILSPDGDKVIFTSYRSGNEELWVLDLTSHQYLQLSDHTTPNILPRSAIWRNNNEVHALAYEARENKLVKFNL